MDREQVVDKDFDLMGLQDLPNPYEQIPLLFNYIVTFRQACVTGFR
jgi:hypothetical protein